MSESPQPSPPVPRLDPVFPYKAIAFDLGFLGAEPVSFDSAPTSDP